MLKSKINPAYVLAAGMLALAVVGLLAGFASHVNAVASRTQNLIKSSTASTSPSYMTAGAATTTLTNTMSGEVDSNAVAIQFAGSTTAAVLNWFFQYSNDGIDWYNEDLSGSTIGVNQSVIAHASTTVTHQWNPGTVATTSKIVLVPEFASKYKRVQFAIPPGGASGAVYAEWITKQDPQ